MIFFVNLHIKRLSALIQNESVNIFVNGVRRLTQIKSISAFIVTSVTSVNGKNSHHTHIT